MDEPTLRPNRLRDVLIFTSAFVFTTGLLTDATNTMFLGLYLLICAVHTSKWKGGT